jgi:hypothetical protein
MSQDRKKYDIEMQTLQTLSQKLASKMPNLCDYACNIYAKELGIIDVYLSVYPNDSKLVAKLTAMREQLKIIGEAVYIRNSDVLTNLGLKVGRTGTRDMNGKRNKEP